MFMLIFVIVIMNGVFLFFWMKIFYFYYLLDFGMVKVVYRDIKGSGKRKINIECRLSLKFI